MIAVRYLKSISISNYKSFVCFPIFGIPKLHAKQVGGFYPVVVNFH